MDNSLYKLIRKIEQTIPVQPTTPPPQTRIRGASDIPTAISRVDSPAERIRPAKPSASAVAGMTADEFRAALVKWPDLHS